jgi:hypothetical protein
MASASKRLLPGNLQSKVDQTAFDEHLKAIRMNAKNMDKLMVETSRSASARIRMLIKYPIDLNSTPSKWLVFNSIPDIEHYLAFAQPNSSNLGQVSANANAQSQQQLLVKTGQISSRGVDKQKRAAAMRVIIFHFC